MRNEDTMTIAMVGKRESGDFMLNDHCVFIVIYDYDIDLGGDIGTAIIIGSIQSESGTMDQEIQCIEWIPAGVGTDWTLGTGLETGFTGNQRESGGNCRFQKGTSSATTFRTRGQPRRT